MAFFEFNLIDEVLHFETTSELKNWVSDEARFWERRTKPADFEGAAGIVLKRQHDFFNELGKAVETATARPEFITRTGGSTERDTLIRLFSRMKPDREDRILCRRVLDDAFLLNLNEDVQAAVSGLFLRAGIPENKTLQKSPEFRDAQLRFILKLTQDRASRTEKIIQRTIEDVKTKYIHTLATDSLITHWDERRKNAKKQTNRQLAAFLIAGGGVIAFTLGSIVLGLEKGLIAIGEPETIIGMAPVALLLGVPLVWSLRHFSRLFLDSQADARDAELRHVMAKSYAAMLTNTGQQPSAQERAIILAALFRPGGSQPPDDGVPLPLIELLKK
jgi:hypothetical protein